MWLLRCDDLDVGLPEPTSLVAPDDGQVVGGQYGAELGRDDGTAAAQHGNGRTSSAAGKDVGEDQHPTWGEHSADLGDPSRRVGPVPQGQGGETRSNTSSANGRRSARPWT
jgi:hypothetical protein